MHRSSCRFTAACHAQRGCDRRDIPIAAGDATALAGRVARMPFHLH
ncbi:MAG: hypothetical protein ACREPV_07750 [Lysobacter sp.]